MRVDGTIAPARHDLRATPSPSCATTSRRPVAEAHDPVAEHGPLPRRPTPRSTSRSTRTWTSSGPTSPARTREEIRRLYDLGCRYLQLDDTSLAYVNDPEQREHIADIGGDPEHQHEQYIANINRALAGRPDDLAVTTHLCRGNNQSMWAAEGGYDFVAEALFSDLDVDGFFLECDDERSGGFEPLRFVPKGKHVVLGLVTTKQRRAREQGRAQAPHRGGREVRRRSTSSACRRSAASPPPRRATT